MNVLFIGNSYTYFNDLDQVFEAVCRANGREVSAYRVTKGGRKLIANTDPEDPITQQLEQALAARHYDVCFIQEQSVLPASDYNTFRKGLEQVRQMIGDRADRLYLYATWGRKAGHKVLEEYGWTTRTMAEALYEGYTRAAREVGATVSPVGKSFLWITEHCPNIELYDPDKTHPSYLGTCLAALTHYRTLFGETPQVIPFELTDEQKIAFKQAIGGKAELVVELLQKKGWTISFAESCTGGKAAAELVDAPGASAVFNESYVTYANESKVKILGVSPKVIGAYGVVSEPVAALMAAGVARAASAQVGVGITGIAGPGGGTAQKPVGMVCFAFFIAGKTVTKTVQFGNIGRGNVRRAAVEFVYDTLLQLLS